MQSMQCSAGLNQLKLFYRVLRKHLCNMQREWQCGRVAEHKSANVINGCKAEPNVYLK